MTEMLLTAVEDGIATLTLNRPERKNALNPPLMKRLTAGIREMSELSDVRVIILTGAEGSFCSGGDVKAADDVKKPASEELQKPKESREFQERSEWLRRQVEAARLLHIAPKPTVAMIRGAAAGAGLNLASACDFRIASENSIYVTGFAKIGWSGDYGGSYFLTRLLGTARARELFMLSERITSAQAFEMGLVTRLVSDEKLEEETYAFARKLVDTPGEALRFMKRNLNFAEEGRLEDVLDFEVVNMQLSQVALRASLTAKKEK